MMANYALIVAGGKGLRMNSEIPKQFLLLDNKPVLMHSVLKFYQFDTDIRIIISLNSQYHQYWKDLCLQYGFQIPHLLCEGGSERFFSVKNGLSLIGDDTLVAIHDGVRPLVSIQLISLCFKTAKQYGSAIPAANIAESIRQTSQNGSKPVNRNDFKLIQTPQVFHSSMIKKAYQTGFHPSFTDDAIVFEKTFGNVTLVEGEKTNLKITTPDDLIIANALLKHSDS